MSAPAPSAPSAPAPRLPAGEIPSAWSRPAEAITTVPTRTKGLSPTGPVVGLVVALGTAAAVYVALPHLGPPPAPPAAGAPDVEPAAGQGAAGHAGAAGVAAQAPEIPPPPPTSSTTPSALAPEDQGGDVVAARTIPPPPTVPAVRATANPATASATNASATNASATTASTTASANASALPVSDDASDDPRTTLTELPARKKAKRLTARAIVSLRGGDVAAAEPVLVRAVLIDPTLADAWRHLGITRAQLGDVDGARRAYRKYLELAPQAPDAAQVRAILGQ